MNYNIFYGCDEPFIVTAPDSWEAKEKGILMVAAKYPNRNISLVDVVARKVTQ